MTKPNSLLEKIIALQITALNTNTASDQLLHDLFNRRLIKMMRNETWSSAPFFSNQTYSFGKARGNDLLHKYAEKSLIDQSDQCNKNRIDLAQLPSVLALNKSLTNFRFVILNINGSLEIFFAACFYKRDDMTHSQLASSMNMPAYCVAAGEISFTNINGKLCVSRLSNVSEQFTCSSETLSVVLDVLLNDSSLTYVRTIKFELTDNIHTITTVNIDFAQLQQHYTAFIQAGAIKNITPLTQNTSNQAVLQSADDSDETESENDLVSLAPLPSLPQLPLPTVSIRPQAEEGEVTPQSNLGLFQGPTKRALEQNDEDEDDEQDNEASGEKFISRARR